MEKKFNVDNIVFEYRPQTFEPSILKDQEVVLESNMESKESLGELYISDDAKNTIFNHINWSKNSNENSVEQGGLLIGHSYIYHDTGDPEESKNIGFVEHAIPAVTAKGSMSYLEFDHKTWKLMMDELDRINDKNENHEFQVIGWYHTHPGRLSVYMSGTDLNTQKKMFSKNWQFAIVLNPQKQIWRAFQGAEAKECKGHILK